MMDKSAQILTATLSSRHVNALCRNRPIGNATVSTARRAAPKPLASDLTLCYRSDDDESKPPLTISG